LYLIRKPVDLGSNNNHDLKNMKYAISLLVVVLAGGCTNSLDSPFYRQNPFDVFNAEEVRKSEIEPDINTVGMRKVAGQVVNIEGVERKPSTINSINIDYIAKDVPYIIDDIEYLSVTNFKGFPLYYIQVDNDITLEVGTRKSFAIGECVLVWYDKAMGEGPSLSMPGQAGISKSNECEG
jgi:hypothetical protein